MKNPYADPSPEAIAAVRALAERVLTADELAQYADSPLSDEEREESYAAREWFCRRYPTPLARLVSARQAYARAKRRMPL